MLLWAGAGLAGLALASLFHVWVPPEDPRFVICLFRRLTGIPCPGCGMTRAFAHLAKGEWAAAWVSHPLSFALAPQIGFHRCFGDREHLALDALALLVGAFPDVGELLRRSYLSCNRW